MIGARFGRLVVISAGRKVRAGRHWICRCDCGSVTEPMEQSLMRGATKSCGCLCKETTAKRVTTHGHASKSGHSSEYRSWRAMKVRCLSKRHAEYANYGGRGISICPQWLADFQVFLRDMGPKPTPRHTIDRIDNDIGYEPNNCRWLTRKEQGQNTSKTLHVEWRGETRTIAEWSKIVGIDRRTLWWRLKNWSVDDALSRPIATTEIGITADELLSNHDSA